MPNRVRTMFGAYDLYAKLLPGSVFFVGILSMLPGLPDIGTEEGPLVLVTISLFTVLVFGFMIGQALHSIAVSIEGFLYKIGILIYTGKYLSPLRKENLSSRRSSIKKFTGDSPQGLYKYFLMISGVIRYPALYLIKLYCWLLVQIQGLLIPHRQWFRDLLTDQYENDDPDPIYVWFKITCRHQLDDFQMDLSERYKDVYRFVMSSLEFMESGRARQFQAMAAFCRGMWITLCFFTSVYVLMLFVNPTEFLNYEPMIYDVLLNNSLLIPSVMIAGAILFMSSTKQYKRNFIEYIAVDFYTVTEYRGNIITDENQP